MHQITTTTLLQISLPTRPREMAVVAGPLAVPRLIVTARRTVDMAEAFPVGDHQRIGDVQVKPTSMSEGEVMNPTGGPMMFIRHGEARKPYPPLLLPAGNPLKTSPADRRTVNEVPNLVDVPVKPLAWQATTRPWHRLKARQPLVR